jgi:hypothetical protein
MNRTEKALFLLPYGYLVLVLLPAMVCWQSTESELILGTVGIDKLIVGFGVLIAASMATILRDLYLRRFPGGTSRLRWLLLMFYTAGVGYFVYVARHAWKPREPSNPRMQTDAAVNGDGGDEGE